MILAHFCRDFSESDSGRFLYLANMLSEKHTVEIVTSDFYHREKRYRTKPAVERNFKITFLHEPCYRKNVGIKRFYSHYKFGSAVAKYLAVRKKPDVIYCAVPSLTAPQVAAEYCEKNQIRFIVDIQDLWPEAFRIVLCKYPLLRKIRLNFLKEKADAIYARADGIAAVSETYVNRALSVNRKCGSGQAVYLGTDLEKFDEYASGEPIIEKTSGEVWLGYIGTLGANYDIPCVIRALKRMNHPPKFIVMGNGPMAVPFKELAKKEQIDAVFTGLLPYEKMCAVLARCDIAVNPIRSGAAASIINKHGDYAAAGIPIVSMQDSPEYRKLIDEYQMGFDCPCGDDKELANRLEELVCNTKMAKAMGRNARRCAEERFDRRKTYLNLIRPIIEG